MPKEIQKLVFNYYEKLMAKVKTKEWTSGFFLFDIGLFQGCVLSTILFICVFQLLLDFLKPLRKKHGFRFKQTATRILAEAYADDLAQVTKDARGNQICCDATDKWLKWTKTMRAKPVKCISWGMKRFNNYKSEKFEPVNGKTYDAFDPKLTIAGKQMNYILNEDGDAFKDRHFKFLGRQVRYDLGEHEIKEKIYKDFVTDVDKVAKDPVNGLMKLWLYQFGIRLRMTWPLLIHDLDVTFATTLQTHIQPLLKKWAGVGKTVDPGILYRAYDHLGLRLTSMADHYKSSQLVKAQLLKYSVDANVRKVWQAKEDTEAKMTRHFKASRLGTVAEAQVKLDLQYPTQVGRQGLGHGNFKVDRTRAELRKLVSETAHAFAEQKRMAHVHTLAQRNMDKLVRLRRASRPLLAKLDLRAGTARYQVHSERHGELAQDSGHDEGLGLQKDCVLSAVQTSTVHAPPHHQRLQGCPRPRTIHLASRLHPGVPWTSDERAGRQSKREGAEKGHGVAHRQELRASWNQASGQTAQEHREQGHAAERSHRLESPCRSRQQIVYPPKICGTTQRPDIVIWSAATKRVVNAELTCPAEEGIEAAQTRKEGRYHLLKCEAKDRGWDSQVATLEVGARGYVAHTVPRVLKRLGRGSKDISADMRNLSNLVARCTYGIYLARASEGWDVKRERLTVQGLASTAIPKPPTE